MKTITLAFVALVCLAKPSYQILLQCRNPNIQSAVMAVENGTSSSSTTGDDGQWPPCSQDLLQYYTGALDQCQMINTFADKSISCQQCAADSLLNTVCQSKLNTTDPCPVCADPEIMQKSSCYNSQVISGPPTAGMPVCGEFLSANYGTAFEHCAIAHNRAGPGCRHCAYGYRLNAECNSLINLVDAEKRCGVCEPIPADQVARMPFTGESSSASTSPRSLLSLLLL